MRLLHTARSYLLPLALGYLLGLLLVVPLSAQGTKNITHGDGFNVCYDVTAPAGQPALTLATAQALTTDIRFDGASSPATLAPTWVATATAGTFQVQFPESKFPASAQSVGNHSYALTIGGATITLADGSTLQPGTSVTDTYTIVCKTCGPVLSSPKWIKIAGSVALGLAVGLAFFFGRHG